MNKIGKFILAFILGILTVSCAEKQEEKQVKSSGIKITSPMSYWTTEQKETIASAKQVDEAGYLYEMDYLADYKLDEILSKDTWPGHREKFHQAILKDSVAQSNENTKSGCAAFATTDAQGNPILARNYDWDNDDRIHVALHTHPKNGYASVGMSDVGFMQVNRADLSNPKVQEGLLYAPYFTVDGINEKGFACSVLLLEEKGVNQTNGNTKLVATLVVRLLLDKAATVDEAIELIKKYDVVSPFYKEITKENPVGGNGLHWMVADASGNKAVLEYVDNTLHVNKQPNSVDYNEKTGEFAITYPHEDKPYQLVTNFYVTEGVKNIKGEGYWRYKVIKDNLEVNAHPTKAEAMNILESARFFMNDVDTIFSLKKEGKDPKDAKNWGWISVWSEIFDMKNKTLDVCIREDYNHIYSFSIR